MRRGVFAENTPHGSADLARKEMLKNPVMTRRKPLTTPYLCRIFVVEQQPDNEGHTCRVGALRRRVLHGRSKDTLAPWASQTEGEVIEMGCDKKDAPKKGTLPCKDKKAPDKKAGKK